MRMILLSMLLIAVVVISCDDGKADATEKTEQAQEQSGPIIDLSDEDMLLTVELPFGREVEEGTVKWNDEFGRIEISSKEDFAITITEEPGDIARLKADLERDLLRTHEVVEESPDLLIYRSSYPDENLVFLHFYQVMKVDDREFVVEDMTDGKFNERQIRIMSQAVKPRVAV